MELTYQLTREETRRWFRLTREASRTAGIPRGASVPMLGLSIAATVLAGENQGYTSTIALEAGFAVVITLLMVAFPKFFPWLSRPWMNAPGQRITDGFISKLGRPTTLDFAVDEDGLVFLTDRCPWEAVDFAVFGADSLFVRAHTPVLIPARVFDTREDFEAVVDAARAKIPAESQWDEADVDQPPMSWREAFIKTLKFDLAMVVVGAVIGLGIFAFYMVQQARH